MLESILSLQMQSAHAQVVQLATGNHIVAFIVLKIIANWHHEVGTIPLTSEQNLVFDAEIFQATKALHENIPWQSSNFTQL